MCCSVAAKSPAYEAGLRIAEEFSSDYTRNRPGGVSPLSVSMCCLNGLRMVDFF
jgi:hypothetical protein